MTHSIYINIADFIVVLHTSEDGVAQRILQRYSEFLCPPQTPSVTINITTKEGAQYIVPEVGSTWVSNVAIEGDILRYTSYLVDAKLHMPTGHADLEMAPNGEVENFLRSVYAWLSIRNDSILLHGAGVIRQGDGYVFFGPSGAGKSTTSAISAENGADVVSDDIVILRYQDGAYHLCGVPFLGLLAAGPRQNLRAPLKGIFRLQQDMVHMIRPMPRIMQIAELAASAPFVVQHPDLGDTLMDVCTKLAKTVPVQKLHFKRDAGYWDVIDKQQQTAAAQPV